MITLGADIELVARQANVNRSVVDLIGGTKDHPLVVPYGNLQEDNVLAEFAIDPVQDEDSWVKSILSVREQLQLKLGGLELAVMPSATFPDEELNHPKALEFGCDPDINAWTFQENDPPDPFDVGSLRTCGGHIHIGYEVDEEDVISRYNLIQWMDIYLGLPSVLLDSDSQRRTVYGKAGSCRIKKYGVEYRTLSNFWIKDENVLRWAYNQTHQAFQRAENEFAFDSGRDNISEAVQEAINQSDASLAKEIMTDMGVDYGIAG